MLRATIATTWLAGSVACSAGTPPPTPVQAPSKAAPPQATPTREAPTKEPELLPDPITKPLDEAEARAEASRLAERAFAARTDLVGASGKPVGPRTFPPDKFVGGLEDGRWKLRNEPPAGAWARVSFGQFGERPEVEVGFAAE